MFPDGQMLFRKCVETKGVKDETYHAALKHIQSQCRENGIDAALKGFRNTDAPELPNMQLALGYIDKVDVN